MNTQRKKQLLQKYKDRKPEMGVISFCCQETGESFLRISTGFKVTVLRTLKYEDASADHTDELEELRHECMSEDPKARKIWK